MAGVTIKGIAGSSGGGEEVLVICALIDILQQYGTRKKLEHSFKSIKYRSERDGISVTDPGRYGERFSKFILSKFCAAPPEAGIAARGASAITEGGDNADKAEEGAGGAPQGE